MKGTKSLHSPGRNSSVVYEGILQHSFRTNLQKSPAGHPLDRSADFIYNWSQSFDEHHAYKSPHRQTGIMSVLPFTNVNGWNKPNSCTNIFPAYIENLRGVSDPVLRNNLQKYTKNIKNAKKITKCWI